MRGRIKVAVAGALVAGAAAAGTVAFADGGNGIRETLTGYEEDPLVLSTTGSGEFKAWIGGKGEAIRYQLSYADLEGEVTQAHIHLGGRAQSGGIIAFLCTNIGGGPAANPPQACPPAPATIRGTLTAADVIGPSGQGIDAGEFGEFVAAVRAGVTYANLHTRKYPGGEIRAQLDPIQQD
jgi:hypothetical protein